MISHDGILHCSQIISKSMTNLNPGNERIITYLPLNHMAAQLFDIFMAMENGASVYFADRNAMKGTLSKTFVDARPTIFFGVPRIFEKIHEHLTLVEANSQGFRKYIGQKAKSIMMEYHLKQIER